MTAIEHHHGTEIPGQSAHPKGLPLWLWRLLTVSILLTILFAIKTVSHESAKVQRAELMYSGVHRWASAAGVGEVLFCAADEEFGEGNTHLIEGLVMGSQTEPANKPNVYHWICAENGTVLRAFNPTEWKTEEGLHHFQRTHPKN